MQFHLPKPLHGWREFAGEVGIIVIGVLIALGAGSLLDDWRWHRQVAQANETFKKELGVSARYAYERFAIQRCLTNRLKEIAARLDEPGSKWRGMPAHFNNEGAYYFNALPVVYRPPTRNATTSGWNNALSNGTINHLPVDRALRFSDLYNDIQRFQDDQREEGIAIAKLSPLASDRVLNQDQRLQMLQAVSELDRINDLIVRVSRDFLDTLKAEHLGFDDAEVQRDRIEVLQVQRSYRGSCVEPLPLDLN
jgi:hypothetical protein